MGRRINYNSDKCSVLVTEYGFNFSSMRWHSNQYTSVDVNRITYNHIVEFLINILSNKKCCKCSSNIFVLGNIEVRIFDSEVKVQIHAYSNQNKYSPATAEDINSNIIYLKERFML